jgi:hypothetical protein
MPPSPGGDEKKSQLSLANAGELTILHFFIWIQKDYQKPSPDGGFSTDRAIAIEGYCPVGLPWQ